MTAVSIRPSDSGQHRRPPATLRILIVDDSADQAMGLAELLRSWGYEAEYALNATAATTIAESFRPLVVLLDLGLPDLPGYELAKLLRQGAKNRRMHIVVITGWTQVADQAQSTAAGVSHHLIKPVNLDVLRRLLASYQAAEGVPAV